MSLNFLFSYCRTWNMAGDLSFLKLFAFVSPILNLYLKNTYAILLGFEGYKSHYIFLEKKKETFMYVWTHVREVKDW